jgi:hypothetical protein
MEMGDIIPIINGKRCDGFCFRCFYRMHCNRFSSEFENASTKSNRKYSHRNPRKRIFPKVEGNANVRILGQDFKHEKRREKK